MKNISLLFTFYILTFTLSAQTVQQKLQKAYQQFETDTQLRHAISSLYVINAKTGEVVFDKNSQIGLAGASTQKIITAATAFELLGKDYRYKTGFYYKHPNQNISGDFILIKSSGDPTFGSWRYAVSKPDTIFASLSKAIEINKVSLNKLSYFAVDTPFETQAIPDGWMWQDIGNYYGAGAYSFNWRENQTDVELSSGPKLKSDVAIKFDESILQRGHILNELKAGPKNSGDNAYYYFEYGNSSHSFSLLKGTIPSGEENFKISIAVSDPYSYFINDFRKKTSSANDGSLLGNDLTELRKWIDSLNAWNGKAIYTYYSPTLDSIVYFFLKRSINLYGEALIKTFAYEKKGFGSTDSGIVVVKDFWKQKGLDPEEINIKDGSGLSPQNRITTHAQVEILKYAKQQPWFPYFFDALPEFNNMKMKSGTIADAKGFCGYHIAADGNEYIFSFLINNYSGRSSAVVNKMYKVLDVLK